MYDYQDTFEDKLREAIKALHIDRDPDEAMKCWGRLEHQFPQELERFQSAAGGLIDLDIPCVG